MVTMDKKVMGVQQVDVAFMVDKPMTIIVKEVDVMRVVS